VGAVAASGGNVRANSRKREVSAKLGRMDEKEKRKGRGGGKGGAAFNNAEKKRRRLHCSGNGTKKVRPNTNKDGWGLREVL